MKRRSTAIGCCSASDRVQRTPGKRGQPPAPPVRPCGAAFLGVHPIPAESGCALSKPACYVIFRSFVGRCSKDFFCLVELDKFAEKEKAGVFRHTRCLLHVVRDDHDRVVLLQLEDEFLDLAGRNRIQTRSASVQPPRCRKLTSWERGWAFEIPFRCGAESW